MNSKMTMGRIQGLAKNDVPAAQKLLMLQLRLGTLLAMILAGPRLIFVGRG